MWIKLPDTVLAQVPGIYQSQEAAKVKKMVSKVISVNSKEIRSSEVTS